MRTLARRGIMFRFIDHLARLFALLGGVVLAALILMTCLSITGRALNSVLHSDIVQAWAGDLAAVLLRSGIGPINGDFELVEAGMAFAIFAFLPLCQLRGAHASVDIITARLSPATQRVLRMGIEVVFAAVLVLIAWKLFEGMESKRRSGQTTLLLEYPLWWAYAASLVGSVVAALVAIFVAFVRCMEAAVGHDLLPADGEAGQ